MPKPILMKGKLASTGNIVIADDTEIQELDQEGVYKYLGVDESDGIQHSKMKQKIRKEYNRRVRLILRTELNLRLTERMKIWKTQLGANNEPIGEVEINREIFQGDSLSPPCLSSQCYLSHASYVRPLEVTNLARKREKSIIYCSWKM